MNNGFKFSPTTKSLCVLFECEFICRFNEEHKAKLAKSSASQGPHGNGAYLRFL